MPETPSKIPPQSTIIGTVIMLFAVAPYALWIAGITGLLELAWELPTTVIIVLTIFPLAVGGMLIRGEGRTVGEAFMWWFKSRRLPVGDDDST